MSTAETVGEPEQKPGGFAGASLSNAVGSLVFALVGGWSAWEGKSLGLFQFGTPAPGLFPFIFGVLLAVIALLSLVVDLAKFRQMARAVPAEIVSDDSEPGGRRRVIGYLLVGAGCGLIMKSIGFVPAAILSMLVLVRVIERLSWRTAILIAVGSTIVADLLFVRLLAVPLPSIPF